MIGYRALVLRADGSVHSIHASHIWTGEGNQAVCQVGQGNLNRPSLRKPPMDMPCPLPPAPECLCGFYAWPSPEMACYQAGGNIYAVVEVYGRVIEHTDGVLRAEWIRILALVTYPGDDDMPYPFELPPPPLVSPQMLQEVAERMNVPYHVAEDMPGAAAFLRSVVKGMS